MLLLEQGIGPCAKAQGTPLPGPPPHYGLCWLLQDLVPIADLASPNKTHDLRSYEGWAYAARTPEKDIFLAYFEKGCPRSQIRGARLNSVYRAQWFDPRDGTWRDAGNGKLQSSRIGIIMLPDFPGDTDWGLRLTYEGRAPSGR